MKPGKVLLFGLFGLVVAQFIGYWQQSASPLLASILTIGAGSIPLFVDYAKQRDQSVATDTQATSTHRGQRSAPPSTRASGVGALVVALAVLIAVGGGIAWGASYLFGIVTGTESAEQRLIRPVSGKAGALTVRVDELGVGGQTTQLLVTATNRADFPVAIPLFDNCQLVEAGRPALEAQVGFTTNVLNVPAGSVPITKRLVFSQTPSKTAISLSLSCTRLHWQGFGQPKSLRVKGIMLHP